MTIIHWSTQSEKDVNNNYYNYIIIISINLYNLFIKYIYLWNLYLYTHVCMYVFILIFIYQVILWRKIIYNKNIREEGDRKIIIQYVTKNQESHTNFYFRFLYHKIEMCDLMNYFNSDIKPIIRYRVQLMNYLVIISLLN